MRQISAFEASQAAGAGFLDIAYLGLYVGTCSGLSSACAAGLGPVAMVAAGAAGGAAALGYFYPDRTVLGAGCGAVGGAIGSLVLEAVIASNDPTPIIAAGVAGTWATLFGVAAIKSIN